MEYNLIFDAPVACGCAHQRDRSGRLIEPQLQNKRAATSPATTVTAVAIRSGLPSVIPARTIAITVFTKVLESAAITIAITATRASPDLASSAMESVMASTSTRPERAATA